MLTVRVSGFQPEFGIDTTTVWSPKVRLVLMGVVLPVSTPSTETFAPDGNEVIFSTPPCSAAKSTVAASATQTATAKKGVCLYRAAYGFSG